MGSEHVAILISLRIPTRLRLLSAITEILQRTYFLPSIPVFGEDLDLNHFLVTRHPRHMVGYVVI